LRNIHLDPHTAVDIDKQVTKILRDLGNPEPPLRLEQVRELLNLAKDYYSNADDGFLTRWIHNMKMAGKQIADRPGFLVDFVRNFRLDALCLFDQKRIMLSEDLPSAKQRWAEGHEIGHIIVPWHGPICLGDDKYTLSAECHESVEAEANFAARRLLFLQDRFKERVRASEPTLQHLQALKKEFGNTLTTTFYGLVEALDIPAFGLVTGHPKKPAADFDPENPCKHFIRSYRFANEFPDIMERDLFRVVLGYCGYGKWNLGAIDRDLTNARGERHLFHIETVFNHYDALTLGLYLRPISTQIVT
jgi:hypothetical protein